MKIPLLILAPIFALTLGSGGQTFTPDLPKETTRTILENLSGLPPPIGGPIPEDEYLSLREPFTLSLQGGRRFTGTLSGIHGERIHIRIIQEGGEVILSFPFDEVQAIYFPGADVVQATLEKIQEEELSQALPYLESIIGARYALFPLIPPEKLSFFRSLPLAALAVNNPAQAIAYVKAIRPYLTLPDDQEELDAIELLGYFRLQLREEAELRADQWIAHSSRFDDSALGYYIRAALQFEAGEFEDALYTALEPIVFSGPFPPSYLPQCYAIAIASAHLLEDSIERDKLYAELQSRDLPWRPLPIFQSAAKGLETLILPDSQGEPLPILIPGEDPAPLFEPSPSTDDSTHFLDPSGLVPL